MLDPVTCDGFASWDPPNDPWSLTQEARLREDKCCLKYITYQDSGMDTPCLLRNDVTQLALELRPDKFPHGYKTLPSQEGDFL